jgi:polysaccharide pyruvyl transferase WcaK-like protein
VGPKHVRAWNEQARAVVIGGGGLFLQDTNPNHTSGWQWSCPIELLGEIKVPLVVFAVGYNRFRGQRDFEPIFARHVTEVARRAAFVGLRNKGSIASIARYLPEDLRAKLTLQPCPTTVVRHIYPDLMHERQRSPGKVLGLNVAFDRSQLRFRDKEEQILSALARAARSAEKQGWRIRLVLHLATDANVLPWLWREKVNFEEVNLAGAPVDDVIRAYCDMDLVLGMRGHAQMIPFGVGTPILSLVSHDKLQWFLDDIGHPDWGIELLAPDLQGRLETSIEGVSRSLEERRAQVQQAGDRIWEVTKNHLRVLAGLLG